MVERFHRSLKSSLRARLAGSDWVSHLNLVLLGLRATLKDDTGLSVSKALYGSPLTLLGELVDVPELLPDAFLRKVDRAIDVFVREDAVISSLAPCYQGPYLFIDRQSEYFRLQIYSKQDVVTIDCLKPVFSDTPVTPVLPPPQGRPRLSPVANSLDPPPSSAVLHHQITQEG